MLKLKISELIFLIFLIGINLWGWKWGLPSSKRTEQVFGNRTILQKYVPVMVNQRQKYYQQIQELYQQKDKEKLSQKIAEVYDYSQKIAPGQEMSQDYKLWQMRGYLLGVQNSDEQRTIVGISQMNPYRLDFNPNDFTYGGLHFDITGFFLFVGKIFRLIKLPQDISVLLLHPEEVRKIYLLARSTVFISAAGAILIVYLFAKKTLGTFPAIFLTIFFSVNPLLNLNSRLLKPHCLAMLLVTEGFIFCWKAISKNNEFEQKTWLVGLFFGLAGAALYPAVLPGVIFWGLTLFLLEPPEQHKLLIGGAVFILVFLIFNYYLPFQFSQFLVQKKGLEILFDYGTFNLSRSIKFLPELFRDSGWIILVPFLIIGSYEMYKYKRKHFWLTVGGLLIFLLMDVFYLKHPNLLLLLNLPIAIILTEGLLKIWKSKWRVAGLGLVILMFVNSLIIASSFISQGNLTNAGEWINANIPADKSIGVFSSYLSPGNFPPINFLRYQLFYVSSDILKQKPVDYIVVSGKIPDELPANYQLVKKFPEPKWYAYSLNYSRIGSENISVWIYQNNDSKKK